MDTSELASKRLLPLPVSEIVQKPDRNVKASLYIQQVRLVGTSLGAQSTKLDK